MSFPIGNRQVGPGEPTYVVAELSCNHQGSFERAVELIRAAKAAGADAVKLQTYTPETMTLQSENEYFRIRGSVPGEGQMLYDLYREAATPWEWHPKLQALAEQLGIGFFSTAFDPTAVAFLESLGVPVHKVASFELVDLPLIEAAARTGKPLILSTGMATLEEIQEAVGAARAAGAAQLMLLKCTSAYPAQPDEMHLRTIPRLRELFNVPVGVSDHTLGMTVPVVAVALGACLVEKHFTVSRASASPDSPFSLEPDEFKAMVEAIRLAEQAMGSVRYGASEREAASRVFRRSLFVAKDVQSGERFTADNVSSVRPGHGLHPRHLRQIIGCTATREIARGTPLSWDLVCRDEARLAR